MTGNKPAFVKKLCIAMTVAFMFLIPGVLKAQQVVNNGSTTAPINFPASTCIYRWVNDHPAIGLAASGTGNISAFTAINTTTSPITATITATPTADGHAYVPNLSSGTLSVINTTTYAVENTITLGTTPVGVAVSPDGSHVYVTNSGSNTISFINTSTNMVDATVSPAYTPQAVAVTPDGKYIYVANAGSNTVSKINTATQAITDITVGNGPAGISISPDGSKIYAANYIDKTVSVIDALTDAVITPVTLGEIPYCTAITGNHLYITNRVAGTVSVINTTSNTLQTTITVGSSPNGITASPDGSKIYVANTNSNTVSVINTTTNTVINTIPTDPNPNGLSLSPDGSLLYVTNNNDPGTVSVFNTSTYATVATVNVGANPFSVGNFVTGPINCTGGTVTYTITVNPTLGPTIVTTGSPSAVGTSYGTPSTPTSFMVSGVSMTAGILVTPPPGFEVSLNNSTWGSTVTIPGTGTIAPTQVFIRLTSKTNAGTYSGNIVLTSAGASPVNVAMPSSTVTPAQLRILVVGRKDYGTTVSSFQADNTTPSFDFNNIGTGLKNGETINSIYVAINGGGAANTPAGIYAGVIVLSQAGGANGFLAGNYNITYVPGDLTVDQVPLTIKASNVNKPAGTALTGGPGSTAYTVSGLQNGETITSVTITYGTGAAANAAPGTYTGSVVPSAPVGGNGFSQGNYIINPIPGDIVVGAVVPVITVSTAPGPLNTIYGSPSPPTNFTISGANMTAGILVTPPPGFEISTDNINYSNTITTGAVGTISSTKFYIRLKSTTPAGPYAGNIVLSSTGASNINVPMPASTVTPAPLTVTADNKSKPYGTPNPTLTETYQGFVNGEGPAQLTTQPTLTTVATQSSSAGQYPIIAVGGVSSNYTFTYVTGILTISPVPLTVTVDNKTKLYGDPNPALTATYQGFVNGDGPSNLTTQPTVTTAATQTSPPGQYPIIASSGVSPNYTFTYASGILTVNAVELALVIPNTFTPNGDGINDTWNINNLNTYASATVQIFNRYGRLVFFSRGYPYPWDGKYKGSNVPDGTYYYLISTGAGKKPYAGYVAVIR